MTKKQFIALADFISDAEGTHKSFTDVQIEYLADFCHSQNPAFKRERWLEYIKGNCDPNGGKMKR